MRWEQARATDQVVALAKALGDEPVILENAVLNALADGYPVRLRARIVQPGYSPTTAIIENSRERTSGLLPPPYAAYAAQFMTSNAGGQITLELDVAKAVWRATNDETTRLRYPAGADAEALAELLRTQPGEAYLGTLRTALGPRPSLE